MLGLFALFGVVFTFFAWKQYRWAVLLLIVALPTYLIRFSIGSLPSTLLELMFGSIFLVWLIRYAKNDFIDLKKYAKKFPWLTWSLALFFAASIAGIFISDMWFYSLGQWRAYFLEPMIFTAILVGRKKMFGEYDLVAALALSTLSISLVAILQKITGSLYPPTLWDDELFGRVTSFFTSPNAVGLYLGPVTILLAALLIEKRGRFSPVLWYSLLATLLVNLTALFFTRSIGAWGAVAVGLAILVWLLGYKKIVLTGLVAALAIGVLPPTRNLLLSKNKSGNNRLTLWTYSQEFLTASPKNFVFGAGIRQFFRKIQKPHYDVEELERLIYPHNIFLNFWTEIGLFGLLSFLGIFGWLLIAASKITKHKSLLGAGLLAALLAWFAHGLIDVPYFKNDLAFLFWIIAAIIIAARTEHNKL